MTLCQSAQAVDYEHRLEFKETVLGGDDYVCLNCGETIHQFIDSHGG